MKSPKDFFFFLKTAVDLGPNPDPKAVAAAVLDALNVEVRASPSSEQSDSPLAKGPSVTADLAVAREGTLHAYR